MNRLKLRQSHQVKNQPKEFCFREVYGLLNCFRSAFCGVNVIGRHSSRSAYQQIIFCNVEFKFVPLAVHIENVTNFSGSMIVQTLVRSLFVVKLKIIFDAGVSLTRSIILIRINIFILILQPLFKNKSVYFGLVK